MRAGTPLSTPTPARRLHVGALSVLAAGPVSRNRSVRPPPRALNRERVFAAGDICSPYKFTHMADALARVVIQNALFLGRAKASALTVPWCTYTDPEIAHVGLYEKEAEERGIPVQTFVQELHEVDRALLDGEAEGFVKIHVREGSDTILGATIVARHAGEMIAELTLAMVKKVGLKTLAAVIHPYPTHTAGQHMRSVKDGSITGVD